MANALLNVIRLANQTERQLNKRYIKEETDTLYLDSFIAAENISAGEIVYLTATGQVGLANASVSNKTEGIGIAFETELSGNDILVFTVAGKSAPYAPGSLTPGTVYYISDTVDGDITPTPSGIATGNAVYKIGIAETTTRIKLMPQFMYVV